ncbi:UxaA family hydrolase [Paracoccus sp. (in: a-proteobacteria)]|uniref:UxaA family hydrolase n=1 Tax=Paracoccus sp. TaxID=267 RepID=UPI003A89CC54
MSNTQGGLLRLAASDNVLVATGPAGPGPAHVNGGDPITLLAAVTLGHKVAARDIARGEKILKYSVPIGSATADIAAGEHVHIHNMKSDYTATHVLDETAKGGSDA